jgi:hypothetical protein
MRVQISVVACTLVCACGGNHSGTMSDASGDGNTITNAVAANARVLHGPSTSAAAGASATRSSTIAGPSTIADGRWAISPTQATVDITGVQFQGDEPGVVADVNFGSCTPSYALDAPTLSQLLDCPFELSPGTYISVGISVSTTFQVLIDDSVNGLYTDPSASTGLATSPPSGGAQAVSVTVSGPGGSGNVLNQAMYFSQPFTIGSDAGSAGSSVDIVEDMVHTLFVNVTGGVPSFDMSLPLPAVQMLASIDGAGGVQFYTSTGTAADTMLGGPTDDDSSSVRVFYDGSGAAAYEFHPVAMGPSQAWAANPATSPSSGSGDFRAGGYLGVDSTGTVCWAIPVDYTYQAYNGFCEMKTLSTIGTTTTLQCESTTTVPSPVSGDTYASGCPAITPTTSVTLTLVAQ